MMHSHDSLPLTEVKLTDSAALKLQEQLYVKSLPLANVINLTEIN